MSMRSKIADRVQQSPTAALRKVWCAIAVFLLALALPFPALALPEESRVPGGIALVRLGAVSLNSAKPRVWLGEQPVWVSANNGQWVAVVGLALDLPPGAHNLRTDDGEVQRQVEFDVRPKNYPSQHIRLKDSSKVTLSPADEARAVAEIAEIQKLKRHWRDEEADDLQFIQPAAGRLASRFGLRRFFNGEARAPHSGLDVAIGRGTPVKATARGTVLAVDDYFFNGKTVFVDHGNGLISMVCHLDRIDVQAGDPVSQNQRVGLSGMTGRASGPHLHWSMVLNGVMVDPALFISRNK
jgi:murein DD-endopeptidase MepM/ murein hydrolase activator NlpD